MKENIKEPKFRYKIKAVELLEVKLNLLKESLPKDTVFQFQISIENRINAENRLIIVVTTIEIIHDNNEGCLGSLQASCIYEIENFEDLIKKETEEIAIPESLSTTLNTISISTVRGIMFAQFRGTVLHNAILPIIDPSAFIKSKVE
jgi:hypothetical protein